MKHEQLKPLMTEGARLESQKEPRPKGGLGRHDWWTSDGSIHLERYDADEGWHFVLQQPDGLRYWIGEIDGPDHGVTFYGPFDGDARTTVARK